MKYYFFKSKCDVNDISAEDYTLLVLNIPQSFNAKNDDYDDDLKDFLENNVLPNE